MPAGARGVVFVRLMAAGLLAVMGGGVPLPAEAGMFASDPQAPIDAHLGERRVKAAYLYKFASYVEWPQGAFANPDSPVVIGVAGDAALRDELARMVQDKSINGRRVQVRTVHPGHPGSGIHVLYAGELADGERDWLRRHLASQPVLLVSDLAQARALGSMVHFVAVDQRLRFDVDLRPVTAGRLKVSALMLSAARRVERWP